MRKVNWSQGLTLIEIMVVMSIVGVIMIPVSDLLVHGWLLQGKAWEMDTVQREGVRALEQLAGGWRNDGQQVDGMRAAREVVFQEDDFTAVGYLVDDQEITYFLQDGQLQRSVVAYDGELSLNTQDGLVVARHVQAFSARPDQENAKLVVVTLLLANDRGQGMSSNLNLGTKIMPRNR